MERIVFAGYFRKKLCKDAKDSIITSFMKRKSLVGLIFIAPLMIAIAVFLFYPMAEAFRLSFFKTNFITAEYRGILNYRHVLKDRFFRQSLWNTFIMMFYQLGLSIPISFIIASLINKIQWGKTFFKAGFFLPPLTSIVASIIVFKYLFYSSKAGIVNYLLGLVGIKPVAWFGVGSILQLTTAFVGTWLVLGYYIIFFLAGMQAIPKELYEAAEVDGAQSFKQWLYITIPCTKKTFAFVFIIGLIQNMQRFTDVYIIRGHDSIKIPIQSVLLYIHDVSFRYNSFGRGLAASYLLFIIILIISLVNVKYTKIFGEY